MKKPFKLISWHEDFISYLLDELYNHQGQDLSGHIFILPHSRPQLYIDKALKSGEKKKLPLVSPRFLTITDLFSLLRQHLYRESTVEIGQMDRIALLLECVRGLPIEDFLFKPKESAGHFLNIDVSANDGLEEFLKKQKLEEEKELKAKFFFPWGLKLSSLFEECFIHGVIPENFYHTDDSVTPYAAKLLEHLRAIFDEYVKKLKERSWTTPGLNAFMVARFLDEEGKLPEKIVNKVFYSLPETGNNIHIAGFFALSGAEEKLFHYLWSELGAKVYLHGDVDSKKHWSCAPLSSWTKKWQAKVESYGEKQKDSSASKFKNIKYTAGFDLHSQLGEVQKILQENPQEKIEDKLTAFAAHTAIILPDTGLLMPALHHLPHTDINISMGYPLSRSPLFTLIDKLFSLHEKARGDEFYWQDLIDLARHPYLKMLSSSASSKNDVKEMEKEPQKLREEDTELCLRKELHNFEHRVRNSQRSFLSPVKLLRNLYASLSEEELPDKKTLKLLIKLKRVLIDNFSSIKSPEAMGLALSKFCKLLLSHGARLWIRFPIDAECLYRLYQSVIPELLESELSHEEFPPKTLFSITRSLLENERVPFEATPLVGLQVLGVLETRLLRFKRVIIPECTDDLIPGVPYGDPLLPEPLRTELGLPSLHRREEVSAYHFYRLLAGADEVHLLWQEGAEGSSLIDGRKTSSRFVEELLWEEEKRQGRLLDRKKDDGPLKNLSSSVGPLYKKITGLSRCEDSDKIMKAILKKSTSSTLLDSYIQCPARFSLQKLLSLEAPDEIMEDKDPLKVGIIIHDTLNEFYSSYKNKQLSDGEFMLKDYGSKLVEIFRAHPDYLVMRETMPADVFSAFSNAGELKLRAYLANQPETMVIALEESFKANFYLDDIDMEVKLTGRADRIDDRNGEKIVLDYKTGYISNFKKVLWEDEAFWESLDTWNPDQPMEHDPLFQLSTYLGSIQLPFYIFLISKLGEKDLRNLFNLNKDCNIEDILSNMNAAFIELREEGKEIFLFAGNTDSDIRKDIIKTKIPKLISFIIKHMATAKKFFPMEGNYCSWCPFAGRCSARA